MAGWVFAATLAAGMALGQAQGSAPAKMKPVLAEASASGQGYKQVGLDATAGTFEVGTGRVSLQVTDKTRDEGALTGDAVAFEARLRVGATDYAINLDRAGWPANTPASAPRPPWALAGGVLLDKDVFGVTGVGSGFYPLSHAAIVAWGFGRVSVDGKTVAEGVPVQVFALSAGFHSDDDTFFPLRTARDKDTELFVLASGLPQSAGIPYLELGFDDVRIQVAGQTVARDDKIASADMSTSLPEGTATGGSGPNFASVLPEAAPVAPGGLAPSVSSAGAVGSGLVATPTPVNGSLATTESPGTPAPANANNAATPLPSSPAPVNASATPVNAVETPFINNGTNTVSSPAPMNASATPMNPVETPFVNNGSSQPVNASTTTAPSSPTALPTSPTPLNATSTSPGFISTPAPLNSTRIAAPVMSAPAHR